MGLATGCAGSSPPRSTLTAERAALLCLINAERRTHGLRALVEVRSLEVAAQTHTRQMVRRNYISHTGPDGSTPLERIRRGGYLSGAGAYSYGENIGFSSLQRGTPASIVRAWIRSPEHLAQILNPSFRASGIGLVRRTPLTFGARGRGVIVTQDFAGRD